MMRKIILTLFILFVSYRCVFTAEPPPGQEAGPQAERFKTSVEQEKKRLEKGKAKPVELEIKQKEEKPALGAVSFELKEIIITGMTVFSPEDLRLIYEPYLNKKVSFKDIEEIMEKIKARYKEKGYLTTTAYLPGQEIKEGKIEIRVVEGKMGKLSIEGNIWFKSALIERFFHLKKNEALNIKKLQRDILRLNKNPDLEVKAAVSPGEEPETSDITLKVKDRFPWHTGVSFDNQGTRLAGKYRSGFYLRSTNATGMADSLFVNPLFTSRSLGYALIYDAPLDTYGARFGFDFTYLKMKLGREFSAFDITGNTHIYNPHISYELALREDFSGYAKMGLEIKSIKKHVLGAVTANDQLRIPYLSFDFKKIDSWQGETTISPKFSFGTKGFLGASSRDHPTASRQGTGGFFFKYEQALTRMQKMPFDSYILARSQFQAASHTQASSEQLQLGGANSIRGYPEGDYLADWGGNLNLDWIFPLKCRIEPVIFLDAGGGKLKKVLSGEKRHKFLAGMGGGFRIKLYDKIYLRLEWAKDLGDEPTKGAGPSTFYLTLQSEL